MIFNFIHVTYSSKSVKDVSFAKSAGDNQGLEKEDMQEMRTDYHSCWQGNQPISNPAMPQTFSRRESSKDPFWIPGRTMTP